jgi:hypothetical protein
MPSSRLHLPGSAEKAAAAIDDALGLLKEFSDARGTVVAPVQDLVGLLAQCKTLCAQQDNARPEPIRMMHHFACTGGSLISKCIAAMPNAQLLSEVDPLSTVHYQGDRPRFAPTDMVTLVRQSTRGASSELIIELFLNNLGIVYSASISVGQRLILRDHAHGLFCTGSEVPKRPSLREIVTSRFPTLSMVTVRHPVDSFLSLESNGWVQFSPPTFDEYCRRYVLFLQAHQSIPIVRYEDFIQNPREVMTRICAVLDLPFSDQFIELFGVFRVSGESGRASNVIETRPRQPIDRDLADEMERAQNYRVLKQLLEYDD